MRKTSSQLFVVLLSLLLTASVALAKDHDQDRKSRVARASTRTTDRDHDRDDRVRRRDHDRDDRRVRRDGDHDRDDRFIGSRGRVVGRTQGRKTGWGNCDLPPGQAKKAGCTPAAAYRAHSHRRAAVISQRPSTARPVRPDRD